MTLHPLGRDISQRVRGLVKSPIRQGIKAIVRPVHSSCYLEMFILDKRRFRLKQERDNILFRRAQIEMELTDLDRRINSIKKRVESDLSQVSHASSRVVGRADGSDLGPIELHTMPMDY